MPAKDPHAILSDMLAKIPESGQTPTASPFDTLSQFAAERKFRITSGRGGRHNPGSKHYQGEAIDIDHRGVDYNRLLADAQSRGFRVLDERTRPPGQAVWGGPHFHIEYVGKPKTAKVQRPQISKSRPAPVAAPQMSVDFGRPLGQVLQTGPDGITRRLPEKPVNIAPQVESAARQAVNVSPVKLQAPQPAQVQAGAQDEDPAFKALSSMLAQVGESQQAQAPASPQEAGPNELESFWNSALNTGSAGFLNLRSKPGIGQTAGQIAGPLVGSLAAAALAPETGFASLALPAAYLGLTGAGSTAREQLNRTGRVDNPMAVASSGLTNAALGALGPLGKGLRLLPRVGLNAGVNAATNAGQDAIQQAAEQRSLTPRLDIGRTGQAAAIGAGLGGGLSAFVKGKPQADLRRSEVAAPEPGTSYHGFVDSKGNEISEARLDRTPTPAAIQPQMMADKAPEMQDAWQKRTQPDQAPEIIDPRYPQEQPLPGYKTEEADAGVQVATRASKRPQLKVEPVSAPMGETVPVRDPNKPPSMLVDAQGRPMADSNPQLMSGRDKALLRAEEIASKPDAEPGRANLQPERPMKAPAAGRPGVSERPQLEIPGRAGPDTSGQLEVPGRPGMAPETSQILDAAGRPAERPQLAPEPAAPEAPPVESKPMDTPAGSYTDTINELLKDTGLDLAGVRKLKADMDTRDALLKGTFKNGRNPEAVRLRKEFKTLKERWKGLDANIQELAGVKFDPETGMGNQRVGENALRYDQVASYLNTDKGRQVAEQYHQAMQNGTRLRERYVAEHAGASREVATKGKGGRVHVAVTEFSPTHFGLQDVTYPGGPRRVVVAHGYNQRGHYAMRYLEPSAKGSHVQQVLSVTDTPAFKGPVANVMRGPEQFSVSDLLARGARTERGFVKTSEAIRAIHEQKQMIREVANSTLMDASQKQQLMSLFDGKELGYDDIRRIKEAIADPRRLPEICGRMGLE